MASTSSSTSTPNRTRFDVFLSFRGQDIRHSFADHLYAALIRAGISTFRDNEEIDRGEKLEPEIVKAIKESKTYIVVLSKNYANSTWCLDELALILKQRRNLNRFVFPIFYHIDPSDIRNQRNSFAINVDVRGERSKWTKYNVNRWKAALKEIADLAGEVVYGSEADFIAKIVDKIDCKLDLKRVSTAAHLTGMDIQAKRINSWLKDEQSGDDVLVVWGMGGIGKTTLARLIYDANKQIFESSSFLEVTGNHYNQPRPLCELQYHLLRDILDGKNQTIRSVSEGTRKIKEALEMKRVLMVLDDIDDHKQLEALLGTTSIHTESKIIITTRRLDVRAWLQSRFWRCRSHELKLLNEDESLELLSFHAFGSKVPMEGLKELAVQLANYCEGNPLALEVLGGSLIVSAEEALEIDSVREIWKSTLDSLKSLKGDIDGRIQGILRRSFDSLPRDSHRELFLDIAFFFVGEYEDYVVKILEHDWHAKSGIKTLVNRCLLTVSPSRKLVVHQLLQDMGRKIVREGCSGPATRSRVSHDEESYHVLQKGHGSKTIEGLALDMERLKQVLQLKPSVIRTDSLAKMDKLKLLHLKYVELNGSFMNLPELRWLCWHGCQIETIQSGLFMSCNLVAIDMSYGNLQTFEPPTVLNSLKILNLKGCSKLSRICNLNRLPNLEELILWNCSYLTEVYGKLGDFKNLALLDMSGCQNLYWKALFHKDLIHQVKTPKCSCFGRASAPLPLVQSFSLPPSLKFLFLNNLRYLHNDRFDDVPVLFTGQPSLYMNLGNNLFEFLPNYIDLKSLRVLDLTACPNLKSLLCLPSTLEELYTYRCGSLEKITFQSTRFPLRVFGYEGCFKLSEVQGLLKLVSVEKLDKEDLGHMKWIKKYQYRKVNLVGDVITKHRQFTIQVLYEYGIMSSYLPGCIEDRIMIMSTYMSSSPFLSFTVPVCPKKRMVQGLRVTSLYRQSGKNEDTLVLFAKISNTTRGVTWIYNPVVVCKPKVGEDVTWSSFWPIGNMLATGDAVEVSIIVGNGLMVSECGVSLGYMDVEAEQENNTKEEEVIGGDLSGFELSRGGWYYLCRYDFFKPTTPDWLRKLVPDTTECTAMELQGWRKSRHSQHLTTSFTELKTFRDAPLDAQGGGAVPFTGENYM